MFKDDAEHETQYCEACLELQKKLEAKERECEEINLTNERLVAEKYTLNEEILRLKKKKEEICTVCPAKNNIKYRNNDNCITFGIKRIIKILRDII